MRLQEAALDKVFAPAGAKAAIEGEIGGVRADALASARNLARMYGREEKWRTERALTRFSMVLSRMSTLPPPKAAVYFADRMRSNAGDHYSYLVAATTVTVGGRSGSPTANADAMQATSRVMAFDSVLDEAAAHGVRLYTVQGEGIVSGYQHVPTSVMTFKAGTDSMLAANQRFTEARSSLGAFAHETGGQVFLHGASAESIADRIQNDLDCFYILSFDPVGLKEDKAMPVLVLMTPPGVKAGTRGRIVIQSESARLESELTAAFVAPDSNDSGPPLRGTIVPLGFEKGEYRALVQVAIPGSPRANATWDVGLSLISGTRVPWKTSRRLAIASPGVPVILEVVVPFDPGLYELVMVAKEEGSATISTGLLEGEWPEPNNRDSSIGPIALLQPGTGAFVRDDDVRRQGSVAQDELARTSLPTALVGIVCYPKKGSLRVERSLVGASSATFPALILDDSTTRCSVFSDSIPADTMTSGSFRYEVRVVHDGVEVASGSREFLAAMESDLDRR